MTPVLFPMFKPEIGVASLTSRPSSSTSILQVPFAFISYPQYYNSLLTGLLTPLFFFPVDSSHCRKKHLSEAQIWLRHHPPSPQHPCYGFPLFGLWPLRVFLPWASVPAASHLSTPVLTIPLQFPRVNLHFRVSLCPEHSSSFLLVLIPTCPQQTHHFLREGFPDALRLRLVTFVCVSLRTR